MLTPQTAQGMKGILEQAFAKYGKMIYAGRFSKDVVEFAMNAAQVGNDNPGLIPDEVLNELNQYVNAYLDKDRNEAKSLAHEIKYFTDELVKETFQNPRAERIVELTKIITGYTRGLNRLAKRNLA